MGFDWIVLKNYKRHYICLNCQKGFKRPSKKDMKYPISTNFSTLMNEYYASNTQEDIIKYINTAHQKMKVVCPNCQNLMLQVHYNFEIPPQRDTKSWKKLQKTMSPNSSINYKTYIQWHYLELEKVVPNSSRFKLLQQNIVKLERLLTD